MAKRTGHLAFCVFIEMGGPQSIGAGAGRGGKRS